MKIRPTNTALGYHVNVDNTRKIIEYIIPKIIQKETIDTLEAWNKLIPSY